MRFWVLVGAVGAVSMAIRAAGPLVLRERRLPAWLAGPFTLLTPVILVGLVAVQTFGHGRHLVLDARAAGVGAAILFAWFRAPIPVVMLAAGVVTALVRWLA